MKKLSSGLFLLVSTSVIASKNVPEMSIKNGYAQLFASIIDFGVHRVLSGVALPNEASIALHMHFGFREVGVFNEYAKKNGKYINSIWLEKALDKDIPLKSS